MRAPLTHHTNKRIQPESAEHARCLYAINSHQREATNQSDGAAPGWSLVVEEARRRHTSPKPDGLLRDVHLNVHLNVHLTGKPDKKKSHLTRRLRPFVAVSHAPTAVKGAFGVATRFAALTLDCSIPARLLRLKRALSNVGAYAGFAPSGGEYSG